MQTLLLPAEICSGVEKSCRSFIWGSSDGKKKQSLVRWEVCRETKRAGGLGVKSQQHMNMALLMKLCWKMVSNPNALWVRVFCAKYNLRKLSVDIPNRKSNRSPCFKSIQTAWEYFAKGLRWDVKDGRSVLFWVDSWLPGSDPLINSAVHALSSSDRHKTVADYVDQEGRWKWSELQGLLPREVIDIIAEVDTPRLGSGTDKPVWTRGPHGCFSTKSAYDFLQTPEHQEPDGVWKLIWRWSGPNRYRTFLWLIARDRLFTNGERWRRHLTISPLCPMCGDELETTIHAIRDCRRIKPLWLALLPQERRVTFFQEVGLIWLRDQLQQKVGEVPWCTLFTVAANSIWRRRNDKVFNQIDSDAMDLLWYIRRRSEEIVYIEKTSRKLLPLQPYSSVNGTRVPDFTIS